MNIVVAGDKDSSPKSMGPNWMWTTTEHTVHFGDRFQGVPDAIISMSISVLEKTWELVKRFPGVPLYCYNWDCYQWIWSTPKSELDRLNLGFYEWDSYGELLKRSTEVWVPSKCTGHRTTQWWDINNWRVILSGVPLWYHPAEDKGYVLCCLRKIPDPFYNNLVWACKELGIPCLHINHGLSASAYRQTLANCRFLVNHFYEASTGGLSLLEGYYLGKPCLVSSSKWNGASDYMMDRAEYFEADDWNHFKNRLASMYNHPVPVRSDHAAFIKDNFSCQVMVDNMIKRVKCEH